MNGDPISGIGESLCATYRELGRRALSLGSSGNVSVRLGDDDMLITPSGASGETVASDQLVRMTLSGRIVSGAKPSSEWMMHAAIYRSYAGAGAVVHAHPDACVALSCLRRPIPAFHYMVAAFGGDDIRCSAYAQFGSRALADATVVALEGRRACLLANHGMICHAGTLDAALADAIKLEMLARQYCLALGLGTPVLLSPQQMAAVHRRYSAGYGSAGKPSEDDEDGG